MTKQLELARAIRRAILDGPKTTFEIYMCLRPLIPPERAARRMRTERARKGRKSSALTLTQDVRAGGRTIVSDRLYAMKAKGEVWNERRDGKILWVGVKRPDLA